MRKAENITKHSTMFAVLSVFVMAVFLGISAHRAVSEGRLFWQLGQLSGEVAIVVERTLAGENASVQANVVQQRLKTLSSSPKIPRYINTPEYRERLAQMSTALQSICCQLGPKVTTPETERIEVLGARFQSLTTQLSGHVLLQSSTRRWQTMALTLFVAVLLVALMLLYMLYSGRCLRAATLTDDLTGIGNQTAFEEGTSHLMLHAAEPIEIIYMNIANFKYVNDTHGYDVGNRLLGTIAKAMKMVCGKDEVCARLTADHFALAVREQKGFVDRLSTQIHAAAKEDIGINIFDAMTLSFGIYTAADATESARSVMDKADVALREIKNRKGTNTVYFDDRLLQKLLSESRQLGRAKTALSEREFLVYLQPKFDLFTLELDGAEALVRWESNELGFLSPDEFIPLFERTGFIGELDFYVLETICCRIQEILSKTDGWVCPVAINFSRFSLFAEDFIERFMEVVNRYNIPRGLIEVEVTESVFMQHAESVVVILDCIRQMGFRISMDDFGAGYSSMGLLSTLPIDTLKIDRSFLVQREQNSKNAGGVIRCIVELAQVLGMQVVCEGIETKEQLEFLQQIGCQVGQGFYFARPMPLADFDRQYNTAQMPEKALGPSKL